MELIVSVIIIILIAFTINFLLYRRKKKHTSIVDSLFLQFKKAAENQNIFEIEALGKELLFNDGLTKIHLDYIAEVINLHFNLSPNLLELKELTMNKQRSWKGYIPYI